MSLMFGQRAVEQTKKGTSFLIKNEGRNLAQSAWTRVATSGPVPVPGADQTGPAGVADKNSKMTKTDGNLDKYQRSYSNLARNIAYRYPNPGLPRHREGGIGGTWRHVKQVTSHNGNRICYVDGLVSVYDNAKFTEKLQAQLPYRPHLRALCFPSTTPALKAAKAPESGGTTYPFLPLDSILRDPKIEQKYNLQERFPTKRKGVYRYL